MRYGRVLIVGGGIAGPVARVFRDAMMPFFLERFAKSGANAWMSGHHIDFDQPIVS